MPKKQFRADQIVLILRHIDMTAGQRVFGGLCDDIA